MAASARSSRQRPARPPRPSRSARPPLPPLSTPLQAIVLLVAAVLACAAVSFALYSPDLWQHLCVGRALWDLHAIPRTNLWSWPTWGAPYVLPSWLFRALLWPVFSAGGADGLMVWRWSTTLIPFAIAGVTARRMGARGLAIPACLLWCAFLARGRSMVRPESLGFVLLAVQMVILAARRRGGRDRSWWIVPLTALWINVHVSFVFSLAITGLHLAVEVVEAARGRRAWSRPRTLALVLAASAAACFANPFGWSLVAEPFRYFFDLRAHAFYVTIPELRPLSLGDHWFDGLPVWLALVAGLRIWNLRRGDPADTLVVTLFLALALQSQRFLGFLCVAAAPVFTSDVAAALARVPWPAPLRPAPVRVSLVLALLVLGAWPQLAGPEPLRPRRGFDRRVFPERACDWIARHGVRGRSFGAFYFSGYQLWRFWPDRGRLGFMDVHGTATREDEDLYAACWVDPVAWSTLDAKYRFEWMILPQVHFAGQDLLDRIDADSTWALTFLDDVASVWLRRTGRTAALAEGWNYRVTPAGEAAFATRMQTAESTPAGRLRLRAELERQTRESEWTWKAHSILASLDLGDARWTDALAELARTRALNPRAPLLEERTRMAEDSLRARGPASRDPS